MAIVTLISDLGTSDYYVAAVKAAVLSQNPNAQIVDITHHVSPFNVYEAAFQLRSVFADFPIGTVHIIGVNPELKMDQAHLVVNYMGHFFVGADNGIFSLLFDTLPEDVWEITLPQGEHWTFPMRGVFATAAAHLSKGGAPELLGRKTSILKTTPSIHPMLEENALKTNVVHIDKYGNVYTSITRDFFQRIRAGRKFSLTFKKASYQIGKISEYFTEVVEGERLAMFATNGLLMVAINGGVTGHGGGASELFGLKVNDIIRIEFHGDPHSEDDI